MRGRLGRLLGRGEPPRPSFAGTLDDLLVERVAAHFDHPTLSGRTVDTGLAGVNIACRVADTSTEGTTYAALYFELWGGAFGPYRSFASISGYGPTLDLAVVEGACLWTCTLRDLIQTAFEGARPHGGIETHSVRVHDRTYRMVVGRIDRAATGDDREEQQPAGLLEEGRRLVGGTGWLADRLAQSDTLPPLVSNRAALLSVFASRMDDHHTTEVKIRGADWKPSLDVVRLDGAFDPSILILLRELAILVPERPGALDRDHVEAMLAAMASTGAEAFRPSGWRGWATHGGRLGATLSDEELAAVERATGQLPDDYRRFLREVAGPGAGPGYGLLSPRLVDGVVPLAFAGCGVAWVLRLDGAERGQVWLDSRGSDEAYRPVAASVSEWYADWLDTGIGSDNPWTPWDTGQCASISILSQLLERAAPEEREAGVLASGESLKMTLRTAGAYAPPETIIDPCHACVATFDSFGIPESAFAMGMYSGEAVAPD